MPISIGLLAIMKFLSFQSLKVCRVEESYVLQFKTPLILEKFIDFQFIWSYIFFVTFVKELHIFAFGFCSF